MRNTRFIFVEGIMGAGKSTTAWFLVEQMQRQGMAARFLAEGPTLDEPLHPLRIANNLPHPKEVWLDATVDEFIEISLQEWREFAQEAHAHETATVCDGLLFHGNMTDLMLMNAAPDVLRRYVEQVIACIGELHPALIYLYHADVAQALRAICDERGSTWEAYQVNWKTRTPYGMQRSLEGFAGLAQLYRDYRALCDEIFAQLTLPKLPLHNDGDWATCYREILAFLHLPSLPESRICNT